MPGQVPRLAAKTYGGYVHKRAGGLFKWYPANGDFSKAHKIWLQIYDKERRTAAGSDDFYEAYFNVFHAAYQKTKKRTWKIFRPQDRWPLPLVTVATLLACVWMVSALLLAGTGEGIAARSILLLTVRGVGMTWAAYECFRYSAMLRKRATIGLGDPMIAHRIWLWGFGAVTVMMTIALEFVSWGLSGVSLAATPMGLHAMSLFGFVATCGIAFAFFPPDFYVRMIERRLAAPDTTA